MSESIRVGVAGCGEVSQVIHLPLLQELDEFRVTALCDLSLSTLDYLGARYGVEFLSTDYRELVASDDVDAVLVATYDHAPLVEAALRAGRHVLVEKPLAFTPEEAAPLVDLAAAAGVVATVGYMKLHDPAVERAQRAIASMQNVRALHVHDFAGRFDRHAPLYTQFRGADVPGASLRAAKDAVASRVEESLGAEHAGYAELYTLLLMLGSHDLAVLRALFGAPEQVPFARARGDEQLFAVLEYGEDLLCTFELGVGGNYEGWDEWVAVYADRLQLRLEFPNPYVRYAPTLLRFREPDEDSPGERIVPVSHESAFRRQWLDFARCVGGESTPRSPLADGLADLETARRIIRAMPPAPETA